MKKVAFHNLGCKVNSYELEGIMQNFQNHGYEIVDFAQKADIYIVNTCTVTNIADRKSRQMLHRAKAQNPEAIVVATGCYVQTDTESSVKDESIDLVVGNNEKSKLLDYVEEYMRREAKADNHWDDMAVKTLGGVTVDDLSIPAEYENFCISETNEHTRAYIKIQDGCNQFCSYCAIPLARGRVRSRSKGDILEEISRLAENDYQEVVLTGIHLSSYGLDFAYNETADEDFSNDALLDVIEAVANIEGIKRIRLGSLEPRLITEGFLSRLVNTKKLCPHFHLSLQSGSDSVLVRMNRKYTAREFKEKTELIRKYYQHPAITTDIIAGFPQETDAEHEATRAFAREINLYETHVFKYSRRKNTLADKMPNQIPDSIKTMRSRELIEDALKRRDDFVAYYLGKSIELLTEDIENIKGKNYRVGYSPEYVKCAVDEKAPANTLIKAVGKSVCDGVLLCECYHMDL